MAGLLIHKVLPVVPPGVNASGVFVLRIVVSATGAVESARLISGSKELAETLEDTVMQWTYKPYLLNGTPVEVETAVSVEFTSGGGAQTVASAANATLSDQELLDKSQAASKRGDEDEALQALHALLDRYPRANEPDILSKLPAETQTRLQQASLILLMEQSSLAYYAETGIHLSKTATGVSPPLVTHSLDPNISQEAMRNYSRGVVLVNLIVDEHGRPQHVQVLKGLGRWPYESAVEALKQYRFKPATADGKPLPVMLNVEINLR
jgi:TonB family protein